MGLSEKTVKICEELSQKGNVIEPMKFEAGGTFSPKITIYAGFMPKKRFGLLHNPPIFWLYEQNGKATLTSLSREYNKNIEEIAKREDFAYIFGKPHRFTFYS